MTRLVEGALVGTGLRVALCCSRFNDTITQRLRDGAVDGLLRHGVADDDITEVWVPGAFKLPLVARTLAGTGRFDAVITLGAVIRGATSHYDAVVGQTTAGIAHAALDTGVPVIFGVLTTDTIEQAVERSGTKAGNKGFECAMAAVELANVLAQLAKP